LIQPLCSRRLPDEGKARLEKRLASEDKNIRWVTRENLEKNRLLKVIPHGGVAGEAKSLKRLGEQMA
jgi:hypothetical protein